ncbi:unnamed protein product [Calypogeia fissa]
MGNVNAKSMQCRCQAGREAHRGAAVQDGGARSGAGGTGNVSPLNQQAARVQQQPEFSGGYAKMANSLRRQGLIHGAAVSGSQEWAQQSAAPGNRHKVQHHASQLLSRAIPGACNGRRDGTVSAPHEQRMKWRPSFSQISEGSP